MLRSDGSLAVWARILLIAVIALGLVVVAPADAFATFFFVTYAVVGALLAIRRPKNLVSWLLIGIAFTFIGTTSQPALDFARVMTATSSLGDEVWVWIGSWSGAATFVLFTVLAATFPTGRLPTGRWRAPLVAGIVAGSAVIVLSMFAPEVSITKGDGEILVPNPIGLIPDFPQLRELLVPIFAVVVAAFALAIVSMVTRYRSASETTQLQLRWLLAAIVFVLVGVITGLVLGSIFPGLNGAEWSVVIVAYPTVPIAIAVAVLRYRLYEIDRIVNRALVYGVVTAILAGIFAAVTLLTQRIFVSLTGQRSDAAIVLTTLAVATLYAPVRKRVESLVDRYFKYDQRLFGAYRDELRKALSVMAPLLAAQKLAHEALGETGAVGVAVADGDGRVLASAGHWPAEPTIEIPVRTDGAAFSAVLLGPRRDQRPHRSQVLASLGDVAAMAAIASTAIQAELDGEPLGTAPV